MSAWVSGERLRYMRRKFIGGDIKMGIKKYFPDALSLCVAEVHTKTVEVAILAIFPLRSRSVVFSVKVQSGKNHLMQISS